MKWEMYDTEEVNPMWFRQHLLSVINRIKDICDEPKLSYKETLILISGLIEFDIFRYKGTWEYLMGDEPRRKKKNSRTKHNSRFMKSKKGLHKT